MPTPQPIYIGRTPQLLVDNHVIEYVNFVTRVTHTPIKHPDNPIVKTDKPWEVTSYFRTNTWNVHWDERESIYKLWYEDMGWDYDEFMRLERSGEGRKDEEVAAIASYDATIDNRLLFAESEDGIHWTKPELDYRMVDGMKTNICFGNEVDGRIHACTILKDPFEDDDSQRYKAIYWNAFTGLEDSRISAAHSADGRKWTRYDRPFTIGQMADRQLGDVIILTADEHTGMYYLDTRARAMQEPPMNPKHARVPGWGPAHFPHDPWRMAKRRVFSSTSYDITNWPVLSEMLVPDDTDDVLDDEFYGLVRFRVGDLWLGLMPIFHRTYNTVDLHLLHSRDGFRWNRVNRGVPFIATSTDGWDRFMAETCSQPIFLDDEIRIYYAGSDLHHDWWMFGEPEGLDVPEAQPGWNGGETALGLATLRPEGFVSLTTDAREGVLGTHTFIGEGTSLIVNAKCSDKGFLDVELTDANDDVVPGYERSSCDIFTGDSTAHVVSWRGRTELPSNVAANGTKLRFHSRYSDLYSFRIA